MLDRLYGWYGKRVVRTVFGVTVVLLVVGVYVAKNHNAKPVSETSEKAQVEVSAVSSLQNESTFSVIGTVRAISEANLETEASGRVVSVGAAIGDTVGAGTVLATIENSRERAQLLQAEGAYESALAASVQSGTSLEEARVGVRNAYRDTFSTVDNVVNNVIDQFFSIPASGIMGFRISGTGNALEYIAKRREIEDQLITWSANITSDFSKMNEPELLTEAETTLTNIANFTAEIATLVSDEDNTKEFSDAELVAYKTELAGARASLDGALATISRARSTYEQAKISGAESPASQSSAQLKSALGTLRSAQANYEKTFVRTPITGVVNAFYLKAGEFTSAGQPAALVANNGSLEISTALGEEDLTTVAIGDIVRINNVATGTVAKLAPAVDPITGKAEIKITLDDAGMLKNGSTVTVVFTRAAKVSDNQNIVIPLASLKLLPSGPIAFGVNAEGVLIAHPVTLGAILGESVEIMNGLTSDMIIVRDARGLKEGDAVTVIQN